MTRPVFAVVSASLQGSFADPSGSAFSSDVLCSHGTQHIFFAPRSLYVLVREIRTAARKLERLTERLERLEVGT